LSHDRLIDISASFSDSENIEIVNIGTDQDKSEGKNTIDLKD
jgi:hypothetical protein